MHIHVEGSFCVKYDFDSYCLCALKYAINIHDCSLFMQQSVIIKIASNKDVERCYNSQDNALG